MKKLLISLSMLIGVVYGQDSLCTLPVTFENFTVNTDSRIATIKFSTGEEINNHHFELQRSFNGLDYENIATIKPNQQRHYVYISETTQDAYYRVKQVDNSNHYSYSKTLFVKYANSKDITAFFAGSQISISIVTKTNSAYEFDVKNFSGQLLLSKKDTLMKGTNFLKLDANFIPYGNYILSIYENSRLIKTIKLKK